MRRLNPTARPKSGAKRGKKAAQRRSKRRFDWQLLWRLRYTIAAVAVTGLTGGLWFSGWIAERAERSLDWSYGLSADAGLAVDDVLVEGRHRTDAGAILAALEVERGLPILAFDPHAAKQRLEALPWVAKAAVERRLPSWIYVSLTERQPLALWQLDGKLTVIDSDGTVIPGAKIERFASLPLVVGQDAPAHAADLLALLDSEPNLRPLVTAAFRVSGRRWNLRLEGGIDVQLPEAGADLAWAKLAEVERQQQVLERDVIVSDLRLPDRLIVRTTGEHGEGENT